MVERIPTVKTAGLLGGLVGACVEGDAVGCDVGARVGEVVGLAEGELVGPDVTTQSGSGDALPFFPTAVEVVDPFFPFGEEDDDDDELPFLPFGVGAAVGAAVG